MNFLDRLGDRRVIILDGATGTELNRRGVDTTLPLWSARALLDAPDVLRRIHADYVRVGAEVLTANTFRTHRRSLAHAGLGDRARELTLAAVEIARQASRDSARPVFVAGSLAPLEDCYSPQLVPPQAECEREHAEMAASLAEAGADLILVETMNTIREALAAAGAALQTGLPVLVGFACRTDGRLFSGETVSQAVQSLARLPVSGLMINCTPAVTILNPFEELMSAVRGLPNPPPVHGLYANIGHADDIQGWTDTSAVEPLEYARLATRWLRLGANLVGGCCGTTPGHIIALRRLIE